MEKGTKVDDIPVVRKRLGQAGIKACFFLQFGYPGETYEDIMATIDLVRDTMPDDIGVSVSYPLKGTKFHDRVQHELGKKDHWDDSNDLDMMFQGPYQTPFYRQLHTLLHQDLTLRWRARAGAANDPGSLARETRELEAAWAQWRASEPAQLNPHATVLPALAGAAPVASITRT
ncbi:MAG: hypothetical protein GKR94_00395 [Gammaproteobacteria bacterium]|nr:hypothetical protein [Gammaproteobacteria bacterium]